MIGPEGTYHAWKCPGPPACYQRLSGLDGVAGGDSRERMIARVTALRPRAGTDIEGSVQVIRTCDDSEAGKIEKLILLNLQFRKMNWLRCCDCIKSSIELLSECPRLAWVVLPLAGGIEETEGQCSLFRVGTAISSLGSSSRA